MAKSSNSLPYIRTFSDLLLAKCLKILIALFYYCVDDSLIMYISYEIADFCQESCRMENNSHFIPIKDVNDNTAMSRYEDESKAEQNYVMEQQQQQNNHHHQHFVENRSMTMK